MELQYDYRTIAASDIGRFRTQLTWIALACAVSMNTVSAADSTPVADDVIEKQRSALEANTQGKGFGPQSPRDIDAVDGDNVVRFSTAPARTQMDLCNIHFHKNAEHAGGDFSTYAGNGDGDGFNTGYTYSDPLTEAEMAPVDQDICLGEHGGLYPGDTIEVHYVHSTARVAPAPTLGACLSEANKNPQLRVEAQVYVLVNDRDALDFKTLTDHQDVDGFDQAVNIPSDTGDPIVYAGSTTGPAYNEEGSPFQVTWSVRPQAAKIDILSVGEWCKSNVFSESYAHGVRNLVTNKSLLSPISD